MAQFNRADSRPRRPASEQFHQGALARVATHRRLARRSARLRRRSEWSAAMAANAGQLRWPGLLAQPAAAHRVCWRLPTLAALARSARVLQPPGLPHHVLSERIARPQTPRLPGRHPLPASAIGLASPTMLQQLQRVVGLSTTPRTAPRHRRERPRTRWPGIRK